MPYSILIKRTAKKTLHKIESLYRSKIEDAIDELAHEPRPYGVRKLAAADLYRIRVLDYRVVYSIDDSVRIVSIERIGHRREIYKEL